MVWNMAFMTFHSVGNFHILGRIIIPTDEQGYFSEGEVETTKQSYPMVGKHFSNIIPLGLPIIYQLTEIFP
jgi:hypothetical protein